MKRYLILIFAFLLVALASGELMAECVSGNCTDGTGTKIYPSGSKYRGEFRNGKEHGQGTLYFFNGSSYEGEFRNGQFHGKGKIQYSNGNEYSGEFLDGKMTGEGEFFPPEKREEVKSIYAFLPENTDLFMTVPSISELYRHFSVRRNMVFGNPAKEASKIEKNLGINPLSIWDLKSIGIDTTKETGFFISRMRIKKKEKPVMNLFLYLPLADYSLFMERIKSTVEKKAPEVTFSEKEGYTVMEKEGQKDKIYLIKIKDYLLIGTNTNGDAVPDIKKILSGKNNLIKSKGYRNFSSRFKSSGKIYFYANINKILKNNRDSLKDLYESMEMYDKRSLKMLLDAYQDYRSAAITLDLDNSDFNLGIYYLMKPGAKTLSLFKGILFNRTSILGIKKNPIVMAILGFNTEKYYNYLISMMPKLITTSLEKKFADIKKKYKLDVEKEIIPNLGGNFNLGIYDGKSLNMFNYNALLTLTIKNRQAIKKAIKKITSTMPEQVIKREKIAGVNAEIYSMGMVNIYTAFKGNQLILSPSKPVFEEAIMAKKTGGFINKINDKKLSASMKKDVSMLYFNVDEAMLAAKNFGRLSKTKSPELENQIKKFVYLLISSKIKKNFVSGQFIVKTRFDEPFFIGLKKFIDEAKRLTVKKKKGARSRSGIPYQK
jgi:hypothetical protein